MAFVRTLRLALLAGQWDHLQDALVSITSRNRSGSRKGGGGDGGIIGYDSKIDLDAYDSAASREILTIKSQLDAYRAIIAISAALREKAHWGQCINGIVDPAAVQV